MKQEQKSLFEYLFDCARDDDVTRMKSMLKHSKPELIARYMRMHSAQHGCTLLQHAFSQGANAQTLAYLIDSGSQINDKDAEGRGLFYLKPFHVNHHLESIYLMIPHYIRNNPNIVNPQTPELLEKKERIDVELNQIIRATFVRIRERKNLFEDDETAAQFFNSLQKLVENYEGSNYWGIKQTSLITLLMVLSDSLGHHTTNRIFDILADHGSLYYAGSQDALGLCLQSQQFEWWKILIDKGDMKSNLFHSEVKQTIDTCILQKIGNGVLLHPFIQYYETKKEQAMLKDNVVKTNSIKTSFKI